MYFYRSKSGENNSKTNLKIIFFITILLASVAVSRAQTENCRLSLSDAPALRGFRLGMSPDEARNVSGGKLKIKIKREGSFFGYFIEERPPAFLRDVRALYLRFFDAKLFQIEIFYEPSASTQTLDEFTAQISAQTNLPAELWTGGQNRAAVTCDEFSIVADNILNPRVELTDEKTRVLFDAAQSK
jgi:hypothetical protein